MTADRDRSPLALYGAGRSPGSGLTDGQLGELERLLVADVEARSAQTRQIRELRRRLCAPTGGRDAVRAMLDDRLAEAIAEFSSAARALRAIDRPSYGLCSRCQERIGFAVLQRAPATTRCTRCTRTTGPPGEARHPERP